MATRPPPQTKTILATPLNVEQSKAQRQQRSQARFRDRGGIFVPSNRNTLADILLGKAPPLTKPRRSVSASPSLRRQSKGRRSSPRKSNANTLRRSNSPLKQSRKSTNASRELMTNVESLTDSHVATVAAKAQGKKQEANSAARRTSTKGSKSAEVDPPDGQELGGHSHIGLDVPKKPKPMSSKKPVSYDDETPAVARKPKSKGKGTSKDAALQGLEDPTQSKKGAGKRAPRSSEQPKAAATKATDPRSNTSKTAEVTVSSVSDTSAAASSSAKARQSSSSRSKRRKSGDLYSCGESEDEYVPRVSKKKQAPVRTSSSGTAAPAKKPAQGALPAIIEEDEDQEAAHSNSTLQRPDSVPTSESKLKKDSSSALKSSSKVKTSTAASSKPPTSKVSRVPNSEPKMKPKGLKSGKDSSRKGKAVEPDDDTLDAAPKEGRATLPKSNKRRADDIAEEESEPPTKRPKSATKSTKNANATSDSKKAPSKKRSRDSEDEDDTVAAAKAVPVKKSAKRKKTADAADEVHTADPPNSKTKKGSADSTGQTKKKPAAKDSGSAKKTVKKSIKKAGRKENTQTEKAAQPQALIVKRGPPKSVLARIKASAQINEVDNDPDEIDFLS